MELGAIDAQPSPASARRATRDVNGGFIQHMVAKEFIPGQEFQKTFALAAAGNNVVNAAVVGKQNKVSSLQISNSGTTALQFTILDNATVIFQCQVPPSSGVQACFFNPPLTGTVNTVMNCAISGADTAGSVLVNIQGYTE